MITNNNQRMTVDGDGEVGIGTTNPTNKLEINSGTANTSGVRLTNLTNVIPVAAYDEEAKLIGVSSSGDIVPSPIGQIMADVCIGGTQLTEANTGEIKTVEYNVEKADPYNAWDNVNYNFTAPFTGLYYVSATYAQRNCGANFLYRLGISKPNEAQPGGNSSLGKTTFYTHNTGCSVPGIVSVHDMVFLNAGQTIFFQARNQNAPYDISPWNYDNASQNRAVIVYMSGGQ